MPSPRPKPSRAPDTLDLQRRQLDERLGALTPVESPDGGWIRTIRLALGMTLQQLGTRLQMTPQAVRDLESREQRETISVAKLREAAAALHCELRIVFVPRPSLEESVARQAQRKAHEERERLLHTMRLEAQEEGVGAVLDEAQAVERWRTERAGRLWD